MRVAVDQLKTRNEIVSSPASGAALPNGRRVVFIERWVDSSEHIFIKNALNSEHMSISAKGHKMWRDLVEVTGLKTFKIDAVVYIRSNPSVSHARIVERAKRRRSERNIPFEYIESLHLLYETFATRHVTSPLCTIENTDALSKGAFADAACNAIFTFLQNAAIVEPLAAKNEWSGLSAK
jgi:deoxyadenosine/deoxycytidine kinase